METKNINIHTLEVDRYPKVTLSVDCVVFGIVGKELKVLLIRSDIDEYKNKWTLLGDLVRERESLDMAANRVLKDRTGLTEVYLEQVHTFGEPDRHPAGRVVTTAYYAFVSIQECHLTKAAHELHWHNIKNVGEMAFDHERILDRCLFQLREAVKDRHIAFNLLPEEFSLRQLQDIYEAVLGETLDRRNFRKKVLTFDFIEDTGKLETNVSHRPGKLYRYCKEYEIH